MATYLDFEEPIKELEDQIIQTQEIGENTEVDMQDKINELEKKLNPEFFFRINRSTLLHRQAIENMVVWTKSRLKLDLKPATTEEVLVSYERTGDFKDWIVGR